MDTARRRQTGTRLQLIRLTRSLLSRGRLPGRYLLAEAVARALLRDGDRLEGHVGAYKVDLELRDQIQRQIYFDLYGPEEVELLSRIVGRGDIVFDVGANVGYYSLLCSQLVGSIGSVHAFEPIPENLNRIRSAVIRNRVDNIVINHTAVGSSPGTMKLYVGGEEVGNSGWASIVPSSRRPQSIEVGKIALDDYVQSRDIACVRLIKLDIEGAELSALLGMDRLLSQDDAPDLICEINPFLLQRQGLELAGRDAPPGRTWLRAAPGRRLESGPDRPGAGPASAGEPVLHQAWSAIVTAPRPGPGAAGAAAPADSA